MLLRDESIEDTILPPLEVGGSKGGRIESL
jgi:hypothetical protein